MKHEDMNYTNTNITTIQELVNDTNPHWGNIVLVTTKEYKNIKHINNPGYVWIVYSAFFEDGTVRMYSPRGEWVPGLSCKFFDKYRWYNQKTKHVMKDFVKQVKHICVSENGKLVYR